MKNEPNPMPVAIVNRALLVVCLVAAGNLQAKDYSIADFGVAGDGKTDCTAAFQKAMDAATHSGGGTVSVPNGNYFFAGHLTVPDGVALEGTWKYVPSHNGIRDASLPKPTDGGSTLLATEGAGDESGAPFITLRNNASLKGIVVYYPNQDPDAEPHAYPYAVAMRGKNSAVIDVELLNPYNGIDASGSERFFIRNVDGQPLRRGVYVDSIVDIGRIENVHFNPWWSYKPKLFQWQQKNGEAFIFGRSDWQYVLNTFCFGYNVGYKFIRTGAGVCNGNFLGIGADDCYTSLVVQDSAKFGLLISNGEFVSFDGPDPTMVEISTNNNGSVRFVNCAFWGPCHQIAKVHGKGTVGFSDCTFVHWDRNNEGRAAVQADSGTLLVRGCEFQQDKPQVELGPDCRRAVITGNVMTGKLRISNRSQGNVQISDNAVDQQ
jgi:hypothetical protein